MSMSKAKLTDLARDLILTQRINNMRLETYVKQYMDIIEDLLENTSPDDFWAGFKIYLDQLKISQVDREYMVVAHLYEKKLPPFHRQ